MPQLADLSVIVPLAPDEQAWRTLLPCLHRCLPSQAEIILVFAQGAAAPAASELDAGPRLHIIAAPQGRAAQLSAGAAAASRPWLWFLHADTQLGDAVLAALKQAPDEDYLGYFELQFSDGGPLMKLTELGVWWRCRLFGMPFGDQGFVLRRQLFTALGGYDQSLGSGEDHALVWAAKRATVPLRSMGSALRTSARKYRAQGWWNTTYKHWRLTWRQARAFSRR